MADIKITLLNTRNAVAQANDLHLELNQNEFYIVAGEENATTFEIVYDEAYFPEEKYSFWVEMLNSQGYGIAPAEIKNKTFTLPGGMAVAGYGYISITAHEKGTNTIIAFIPVKIKVQNTIPEWRESISKSTNVWIDEDGFLMLETDDGATHTLGYIRTTIKSKVVDYGTSDSVGTKPTDWTLIPPTPEQGKWLWTRTTIQFTDGDPLVVYSYAHQGVDGAKGDTGIQGPVGPAAGFTTPTATAETLAAGSKATVEVTASGENTAKKFDFTFGIPKGDKGDTGPAAGFTTPTATAETLAAGSKATVEVTASGENTAKKFDFKFGIPQGDRGFSVHVAKADISGSGEVGTTGTTTKDNLSANDSLQVGDIVIDKYHYLDNVEDDLKGAGELAFWQITSISGNTVNLTGQGYVRVSRGEAAGFAEPTASAETISSWSEAKATVTASGEDTAKKFDFKFSIPEGRAAGFTTPIAHAETLGAGEEATASVTASGENTAKQFEFTFGIPKGANGIGALSKGLFQLVVEENGDLYAEYTDIDGGEPPEFEYNNETGALYYLINE